MKELIYNTFSLATIFALACALITDKRLEGVTRLCFSIVFSSVIFLSVGNLFFGGVMLPEYTAPELSSRPSAFDKVLEESAREGVVRALCREFSLSEEEILVQFGECGDGEYLSRAVRITLYGRSALADYRAIENYLYEGGYESVGIKLSLDS